MVPNMGVMAHLIDKDWTPQSLALTVSEAEARHVLGKRKSKKNEPHAALRAMVTWLLP